MMLFLLVFIISIYLLTCFFVGVGLLKLVLKIFKINDVECKKLIIIIACISIFYIVSSGISFLMSVLNFESGFLSVLLNILIIFFEFYVVHLLLWKYFRTNLKKNILIYLTWVVFSVIVLFVVTVAFSVTVRAFLFQPFYIKGDHMEPNFHNNDYVVTKVLDKDYQRGDVIFFSSYQADGTYVVKRIVGMPGERIEVSGGEVRIYNSEGNDFYILDEPYLLEGEETHSSSSDIIFIDEDEYYVLGDKRSIGKDSRHFGVIKKDSIISKYWFTVY